MDSLASVTPVMVAARRNGWLAPRAIGRDTRNDPRTRLVAPDRTAEFAGEVMPSHYDSYNHYLAVRRSPDLLVLEGTGPRGHRDKMITALDPADRDGQPRRRALFPSNGTPCARATGAGLLPGNAFVVRRRLPDGAATWVFTHDHAPTAVESDGTTVYAAFAHGEVVALDARAGTLRWRRQLTVDGIGVVALSMAVRGNGRLLLGTWDGRILDCSVR